MKREIEKNGADGESHKISIEPKSDKGFLKVGYMKHHSHHNEDFKYEFIDPFFEVNNYFIVGIRTQDGRNYLYGKKRSCLRIIKKVCRERV